MKWQMPILCASILLVVLYGPTGADEPIKPQRFAVYISVLQGDPLGSVEEGDVRSLGGGHCVAITGQPFRELKGRDAGCEFDGLVIAQRDGKVHFELAVGPKPGSNFDTIRFRREVVPGQPFRQRLPMKKGTPPTWLECEVRDFKGKA
jgi:hypothetical protein